jgi:hypothetical protein
VLAVQNVHAMLVPRRDYAYALSGIASPGKCGPPQGSSQGACLWNEDRRKIVDRGTVSAYSDLNILCAVLIKTS